MSLKGRFEWYQSLRSGGRKMIRFIITCDNAFQSETFDAAIMSSGNDVQPMVFRQVTVPAKKSLAFDYDTVDWQWCNGDSFVILGKNDSITYSWPLQIQTFEPGECPECHGTKRCLKCYGRGFVYLQDRIEKCRQCHGIGICQTCYVPERSSETIDAPAKISGSPSASARRRRCELLREQISELQHKIDDLEFDIKMWKLKDMDVAHGHNYREYLHLLSEYRMHMSEYKAELRQLENMQ